MTTTLVDQDARARVTDRFDESLLVEAGAGTGKTTALVKRIVNALAAGAATIDDLAVVTFTNDAAAELASRVRERLEERLAEDLSPDERERLEVALRELHRARISTLHVFATTLLRERPVEARVDPGVGTVTWLEREQLFAEAYGAWLDDVLREDDERIALALNRGLTLDNLETICRQLDGERRALPLAPVWVPPVDHTEARATIARLAARLEALAPSCQDPEDFQIVQWPTIQQFCQDFAAAEDELHQERIALFRCPKIDVSKGRQDSWATKEIGKEFKATCGELREAIKAYAGALRGAALAGLMPLAEEFVVRFEEHRRLAGVADFDDLLLWARDLLRRDAAARRWLRDRYRHVLIDEFQDTDPLQAEIALLLTSADEDGPWSEMSPEPGSLVVVGDPKQSIYRFRGGDLATYDATKGGPLGNARAELRQNFRSVGGILEWTNGVFDAVFGEGIAGEQAPQVRLETSAGDRVGERAPVVVVPDANRGEELNADARREREAELVARTLRLAVEVERWPVRDSGVEGGIRDATYGDVAVLLPTRTSLSALLGAFDRHGVPYRADSGTGLFQEPEIAEVVSILRAIDDPSDGVSVVAALRSDAFGCSADDLVRYAAVADGRFDYRRIAEDGPEGVAEGLRTLSAWRRERRGLSLAELVQRVVDASGLVELALERPEGAQVAANVLQVVEEARSFAGTGGGLRGFATWLAERREGDTEAAEAAVADPGDPVVQVKTSHGSKGLEFPIVVLAGLDGRPNVDPPAAIARPDEHRVELKLAGGWETPSYADFAAGEKRLLELEDKRLLYVSITRAKDHLVLPTVRAKDDRIGRLESLGDWLPDDGPAAYGCEVDGVHVLDPGLLPLAPEELATIAPASPVGLESLIADEESWVVDRRGARETASAGLVQTVASSVQPIDRVRPLAAVAAEGDEPDADAEYVPPLTLGTALHIVMSRVALDGSEDPGPLVAAVAADCGIPGAEAELLRMVRFSLSAPSVGRAARSAALQRELPFTLSVDSAGFGVGRIDLVFVEGDGVVVVDYKTDQVGDGSADALTLKAAAHSGQGAVYAVAVERATGLRVREVVWVFSRTGGEHVQVIDGEARALAIELLRAGGALGAEEA
jgi:ATP-dependent helicase/nuclease subunit A